MTIKITLIMFLVSKIYACPQKIPEDFGFKHLMFKYQNDPVSVIIISKKGEEKIAKPLFFFCQGSLPQPVIKYDEKGLYGILPFDENPFLDQFHIAIVGKPFVPIIANTNQLGKDFTYFKDTANEIPPKGYLERNYLEYYVFRNNFILKQLFKERWIKTSKLVVAGHSEGSTIAAKMASMNKKITQLIYASGNPFGRINTILSQTENSTARENTIEYWKEVVQKPNEILIQKGDSFKTTYSFSAPQNQNLMQTNIPILVTYGTKDKALPYLDLFQIDCIRAKKSNFTFVVYRDLDHNFFGLNTENETDFELYNWDKVARHWLEWVQNH